jgi:hypothetical protein
MLRQLPHHPRPHHHRHHRFGIGGVKNHVGQHRAVGGKVVIRAIRDQFLLAFLFAGRLAIDPHISFQIRAFRRLLDHFHLVGLDFRQVFVGRKDDGAIGRQRDVIAVGRLLAHHDVAFEDGRDGPFGRFDCLKCPRHSRKAKPRLRPKRRRARRRLHRHQRLLLHHPWPGRLRAFERHAPQRFCLGVKLGFAAIAADTLGIQDNSLAHLPRDRQSG